MNPLESVNKQIDIINDNKEINNLYGLTVGELTIGPFGYGLISVSNKLSNKYYEVSQVEAINFNVCSSDDLNWAGRESRLQAYNVAYIAAASVANKPVDYNKKLIFTANGKLSDEYSLKRNDQIVSVNGLPVNSTYEVGKILNNLKSNIVPVGIIRGDKQISVNASMKDIGYPPFLTNVYEIKNQDLFKPVDDSNGVGSSSGLMNSIFLYYHMTNGDLGNLKVCGTGTIDEFGNVGQIGGVNFKAMAAHTANADIMFIPKDIYFNSSNEMDAQNTLRELGSKTKVYPVSTLKEAISILDDIKKNGIYH